MPGAWKMRRASWKLLCIEACRNLLASPQRSILALVGLSIGTAAVIAMLNIGSNAMSESQRSFEIMGTDIVSANLLPSDPGRPVGFDEANVAALRRSIPELLDIVPIAIANADIGAHGRTNNTSVVGTVSSFKSLSRTEVSTGRFLSDFDGSEAYAVIGPLLAEQLDMGQVITASDARIQVAQSLFVPIGVMAPNAYSPVLPVAPAESLVVPLESMQRIMHPYWISSVLIRLPPDVDQKTLAARLREAITQLIPSASVSVLSAEQLIESMHLQIRIYTLLLGATGSISLLVGGIGVMNVMLMSVIERRQEIGVRLALGARSTDIKFMFLAEALCLALAGGALGAVLGVFVAAVFSMYSGWRFELAIQAIPIGISAAGATGLFFAYYPAARGARMSPIDALRAA